MCAEYERVERVVQNDVWPEETDANHSVYSSTSAPPDEARMVKKFRRAAAGLEEQLPSDLRPPMVLKRTCDYLFNEVVGNAASLAKVHHFVWDRTRAIRNDFSIQQLTKANDLSMAIDCFERVVRFHIMSLHQLAVDPKPYDKYDAQQEREQLDRTLLSLMQYYDDCRGRMDLPNEAEFRAYCVIFQLQDPTPDLEDRVQSWPRHIVMDMRIRTALDIYAAACNTMDSQGPLKPRASHLVAQQDWQRFWTLIESKQVSYLMACVAEIYFNLVRRTALNAIFRGFKAGPSRSPDDWTLDALLQVLVFDHEGQVHMFCEAYGFSFALRADGQQYLDLTSVKERALPQPNVKMPKQWRSEIVESKRFERVLPAIINGMGVKQAQEAGLTTEEDRDEMKMEDGGLESDMQQQDGSDGEDSLFIPEDKVQGASDDETSASQPLTNGIGGTTTFGAPSGGGSAFGKPSGLPFGQPSGDDKAKSLFSFLPSPPATTTTPPPEKKSEPTTTTSTFSPPMFQPGTFGFNTQPNTQAQSSESPKNQSSFFALPNGQTELSPTEGSSLADRQAPAKSSPGMEDTENQPPTNPFRQPPSHQQTYQKPSVQSAPTSPEKEAFTSNSQPAVADAPSSGASVTSFSPSVTPPETKPSPPQQGQFTAPTSPASNIKELSPPSPSLLSRKLSASHQPKKPSPLYQSTNADDIGESSAGERFGSKAASKQPLKETFPGRFGSDAKQQTKTPSASRPVDFASVVARLAHEITNDQTYGFLNQYVEYAVQQTITSAQEQVALEKKNAEADQWRKSVLLRRYFSRWKNVFWGRKFAKRGSKRRERARRGLEESKRSETNSVLGTSRAGLTVGGMVDDVEAHRQMVDSMFQQTVRNGQRPGAASAEQQAQPGSKRPLSSHDADTSTVSRGPGHKRMKSTSHVDDRGRVTKPAPASNATAELLKRSSFLGFSMPITSLEPASAPRRSNYFRQKALGVDPVGDLLRGTKRRREESAEATPPAKISSSASLRMSTLLNSGAEHSTPSARTSILPKSTAVSDTVVRPASSTAITNDADEALFARLKAAREALADGTKSLQAEVNRQDKFRRSFSASQSSNESPSMATARAEARRRAALGNSTLGTSTSAADVPAYRLRESRFVPREHYGRAIERAQEMRESRSRNASRPESRTEQTEPTVSFSSPAQPRSQPAAFDFGSQSQQQNSFESQTQTSKTNGLSANPKLPQWQPPSAVQDSSQSFFKRSQPVEWGFGGPQTQQMETQTFKKAFEKPNAFSSFGSQNAFDAQPNSPPPATHISAFSAMPSLSSQPSQPVFGAQSRSSPPRVENNDFESQLSHFAYGTQQKTGPQDFTIQPSQLEQLLSNSFGHVSQPVGFGQPANSFDNMQTRGFGQPLLEGFEQHSPTRSQPDSYMHTQIANDVVDLMSDDEEESQPAYANQFAQAPVANGTFDPEEGDEELLDDEAEEEIQDSYQYSNPYAALARDMGGDTEEDVDEEQVGEEFESQVGEEDGVQQQEANGYDYDDEEGGYEDESEEGGYDDEDEDGDIEDAEDFDDEEEPVDDDENGGDPASFHQRFTNGDQYDEEDGEETETEGHVWNQQPPKNPALQGVGGTADEAIELSD